MEHYQQKLECAFCHKNPMIIDIFSNGTMHQMIQGAAHEECARKNPTSRIMEPGEKETI